jgi:hypothetical protein
VWKPADGPPAPTGATTLRLAEPPPSAHSVWCTTRVSGPDPELLPIASNTSISPVPSARDTGRIQKAGHSPAERAPVGNFARTSKVPVCHAARPCVVIIVELYGRPPGKRGS